MIAASRESCGATPVASISVRWVSCQLSFTAMVVPLDPKRRKFGSRTTFGTPTPASEGPMPRMITRFGTSPVTMKPPTMTPSPASTRTRVEMVSACAAGLGLGEGLGLGDGLGLGEVPGLGDGLGLGDVPGLGDGLGLGDVPGLGDGLGLGDVPGLGDGLGLGEGPVPVTIMVALALLRASSIW